MYELTVIIPTLNEAENIRTTVNKVMKVLEENQLFGQVLVVDDNSTDETFPILLDLQAIYPNLTWLIRYENHGLSQSLYDGFWRADSDVFIVMDADGQHPIEKISELYRGICEDNDVVIGSRYMEGGGIKKWGLTRRIISIGATTIARLFFPELTDPGSGFFAVKKKVVEGSMLEPRGYKFLIEILGKGQWESVKEIPIQFAERKVGKSKLKGFTMMEYVKQLWSLFRFSIHHKDSHAYIEFKNVVKYMTVGITGIFVNMGTLIFLTEYVGIYYLISSLFASEASIITNFILNDKWTYGNIADKKYGFGSRLAMFNVICIAGMIVNITVLFVLTDLLGIYYIISNLIGVACVFLWNFIVNRRMTWIQK
jgi:dolichol-phosphate mannosyltransferase